MSACTFTMQIRVINKSGYPLGRSTPGSIGFDLHAVIGQARDLESGRRWHIDTGISIELAPGLGGLVQPRSGLAFHHGVYAITGVIDSDYRGAIKVLLYNASPDVYRINPGDRVAQLVIVHIPRIELVETTEPLDGTERGASGFGSSGR